MLSDKEEQERIILGELHNCEQPLGSGALKEALRTAGMEMSEATVGRLLRDMDTRGYTLRKGFQGRVVTESGVERLQNLERERQRVYCSSELLKTLNTHRKQDLIDILVARRAVEGEIARLAAIHATPAEIKRMTEILRQQEEMVNSGHTGVEQDSEFHQTLAKVGQNQILCAVVDLIKQEGQFSPVLEFIRQQMRGIMIQEHQDILSAIQNREPDKAYQAMVNHIESLINDVVTYWEHLNKK